MTPEGDGVAEEEEALDAESATARPVALSDSAISDISQDRLGFTPYVEAVAEFILAEQTRPPLAIAINAPWGQGKTSFMNMLDAQLKVAAEGSTTRVASTWFNPWKYSEPEQVWGAFVANVTRCLRDNLSREQRWRFQWGRFRQKWHRHADFAFILHLVVALAFLILIFGTATTMSWTELAAWTSTSDSFLGVVYKSISASLGTSLGYALIVLFALLALLYGYITFAKKLGLNLLEYVEKTDFKDKIGTLSQFEDEMRRLADAVPENLKVIVFIDDLDRCKGKVLGEIIEALQLADVSRTCIFVMGMDMQIVAHAIESERKELTASAGNVANMEHGSGYKFLEKIIQARLALPSHSTDEMKDLVASAMERQSAAAGEASDRNSGGYSVPKIPIGETARFLRTAWSRSNAPAAPHHDSNDLIRAAEHYGSRHFRNPRRLKRFINTFRLQTYLANSVRHGAVDLDHLARFLVLVEKWPAVLDYMLKRNANGEFWRQSIFKSKGNHASENTEDIAQGLESLPDEVHQKLVELLEGPGGNDPLGLAEIRDLADWCGFAYYRGITANG